MSCNNCNKNNCSCVTTPQRYNGPAIECLGLDCNLTYDDALARLAEYMCDRALEKGDKGDQGIQGETGADSLVPGPIGDPGTNGTNGSNGTNGTNGTNGINGLNGNGILEIAWTSNSAGQPVTTQGTVDTYTVTYTNATTDTFEVRNGADGTNGIDGADGAPGIDGTNGTDGIDGVDGLNGAPGADGADGIPGIFTATADAVVSNTTSFSTLVGSGVGSMTFPASSLVAGDTFRLKLHGARSMGFATNIIIDIVLGGVVLETHTVGSGNANWTIESEIVVRSIGVAGSVQYGGAFNESKLHSTSVVDTTNGLGTALVVRARFQVADPSNSITSKIVSLTKIF